MMKKFVAYCLLIAFGVLLAPRDLMHDCDHHDSVELSNSDHQDDHSNVPHYDDDCFACDYDMDLAEKPLSFFYRFQKPTYVAFQAFKVTIVDQDEVSTECLRGPPNA